MIRTLLVNLGGLRLDLAGTGAVCRELVRIFPFPFLLSRWLILQGIDEAYREP